VLAVELAVAGDRDRDMAEEQHRADRQHLEREAHEQPEREDGREEDRQHPLPRDVLAHGLARIGRHGRDRQEREAEHVDEHERRHRGSDRHPEEMQVDRQQRGDRAGRRRHPGEEVLLPLGTVRIVQHDVEARQPQRHRHREDQRHGPAERRDVVEHEAVENERWRRAEIEEVGERVEFRPEAGCALEEAREPPVDPVEEGRDQDRVDGGFEAALIGEPDRGEAEAQGDEGDQVRRDDAERNRLEQALARFVGVRCERREQIAHGPGD
jgi:hypothetical protein